MYIYIKLAGISQGTEAKMTSKAKFSSFDDRYVSTTEQPTIIAVQSASTSKKLCVIIAGIVVVAVIATVGVVLGVVILKKGKYQNKKRQLIDNI